MSAISTYLEYIRTKIYAKDVRTAIVNAISQCYDDVNRPALQTEAIQAAVQAKIDAGEMAALTIADRSLTGAKLATGTITTDKIASGVIPAIAVNITDYTLAMGTINGTAGYNSDATNRCRTSNFIHFEGISMRIVAADGYKISGRKYSEANISSYIGSAGAWDNELIVDDNTKYYRLVIAKTDDSTFNISDLPEDVITITAYKATDTTLSVPNKAADAKAVGDSISQINGDIKSYEILTNEANKYINYNYDIPSQREPDPTSSTSLMLGFNRNKNLIILNGELNYNSSSVGTYVKLNGDVSTTYSSNTVDGWGNGVVLETGHQYKVVGKLVSGSFSSTSGKLPSVSVYKVGTHSSVGTVKRDSKHFVRTFTADGSAYHFCIYIPNNTTYTDAGILITLEDVTDSGNNSIIERNDPIRTIALLNALTGKTRISGTTFGKKPLCLIHFSDIHGDAECLKNVIRFKDEYSGYIDDIIHTGDTVHYSAEEGTDFWANTEGAENILNAIGNHDTNTTVTGSNNWTGLGMADSYDTYFSPYIDNWGVTYENGITYYYKDYVTESVRLIVLDIMHQTEDQLSWFVDALAGARSAGLDVIIAAHSKAHWLLTPQDCVWDDRVNVPAYTGVGTDTSANAGGHFPTNFSAEYSDAVDDHIEAGGMFIAWIHGHTHYRILAKLTEHPNQLDMAVANAGRPAGFAWTNVWNRVDNSKSMDDFNVIAIDTTGKILRAAKFGVDTDRHMRIAHTMSYDYDTHTIITAE